MKKLAWLQPPYNQDARRQKGGWFERQRERWEKGFFPQKWRGFFLSCGVFTFTHSPLGVIWGEEERRTVRRSTGETKTGKQLSGGSLSLSLLAVLCWLMHRGRSETVHGYMDARTYDADLDFLSVSRCLKSHAPCEGFANIGAEQVATNLQPWASVSISHCHPSTLLAQYRSGQILTLSRQEDEKMPRPASSAEERLRWHVAPIWAWRLIEHAGLGHLFPGFWRETWRPGSILTVNHPLAAGLQTPVSEIWAVCVCIVSPTSTVHTKSTHWQ